MVVFGGDKNEAIFAAVRAALKGHESMDLAVSYIQTSGWDILQPLVKGKERSIRVVCTDQLGITDPKAVRSMLDAGLDVRAYEGSVVFHPKVMIVRTGVSRNVIVGSANLSRSALITGVEAISITEDQDGAALAWFEKLFDTQSVKFSKKRLAKMEKRFAARVKSNLVFASDQKKAGGGENDVIATDTIEATFSSLPPLVVPLNADKAANNVRTLRRIQAILDEPAILKGKALSEFKLIGFAKNGALSALGKGAQGQSKEEIARLWMQWLKNASTSELKLASPSGMLEQARTAFTTFWNFPVSIRDFYLANCTNPSADERPLLQTIELLANTGRVHPKLTLKNLGTLTAMLDATSGLSAKTREVIRGYLQNKGTRGWGEPDRAILLRAWAAA